MKAFWYSNFLIKLRSWEYWPWYVIYFPIILYWLWLSFKARTFFFYSATNPAMKCGGLFGESKKQILDILPKHLVPVTLLFDSGTHLEQVMIQLQEKELNFPVIAKPDVGERGIFVEKIFNIEELDTYIKSAKYKFQIQEYVTFPIELGVFYYRFPNDSKGCVSSVVQKEMLSVIGDGKSSIRDFIMKNDRAKLQLNVLKHKMDLDEILPLNKKKELVSIGNHCKGTTFLNGAALINDRLVDVFDKIHQQMQGFYYGRFDLRCDSISDLYQGKFKIMELNGAASEPAHIYHPGFSLLKAYKVLFYHWRILYEIGIANHKLGIPYLPSSIGWSMLREHLKSDKYTSGQLG
ncbi:MAG: hypothetical protein OEW67_02800 [Cyclobacteriaceae bacterium]|nr:hypothetical protein [Cyclobacteriaceae bacterium]